MRCFIPLSLLQHLTYLSAVMPSINLSLSGLNKSNFHNPSWEVIFFLPDSWWFFWFFINPHLPPGIYTLFNILLKLDQVLQLWPIQCLSEWRDFNKNVNPVYLVHGQAKKCQSGHFTHYFCNDSEFSIRIIYFQNEILTPNWTAFKFNNQYKQHILWTIYSSFKTFLP